MKNIKNKDIETHNNIYIGMAATFSSSAEGEISSERDGTKKMMKNLNIIQISHLTFECSWLMVPYDILIAGPA